MTHTSERLVIIAAGVILSASLAFNVSVIIKRRPVFHQTSFAPGERVPVMDVKTVDGRAGSLRIVQETVLYIFSPTCGWCKQDYANLKALHEAGRDRYRFVGLTDTKRSAELTRYLDDQPFPGEVWVVDSDGLAEATADRLSSYPQLLVVDSGGIVTRSWAGALYGDRQRDAEAFWAVSLPGLLILSKPAGGAIPTEPVRGLRR